MEKIKKRRGNNSVMEGIEFERIHWVSNWVNIVHLYSGGV
jgi:hypothetical protein